MTVVALVVPVRDVTTRICLALTLRVEFLAAQKALWKLGVIACLLPNTVEVDSSFHLSFFRGGPKWVM